MVTTTTPSCTSWDALYSSLSPKYNAPPWIQNMTAWSCLLSLGANTLRNRQSSFKVPLPNCDNGWAQWPPNRVASTVPDGLWGACGGRQRSAPTGGAAYRIPRNWRMVRVEFSAP